MADPGKSEKANALVEMELSDISKDPREAASSAKTSSSSSHLEEELEQMGSLSILKEGEPLLEPAVEGPDVPEPEDVDAIPDAKSKRIQAKKIEENLDKILCLGSFDAIKEEVTPKTLYCCESNTLLKAFQGASSIEIISDVSFYVYLHDELIGWLIEKSVETSAGIDNSPLEKMNDGMAFIATPPPRMDRNSTIS